jgi:hypothetical protein
MTGARSTSHSRKKRSQAQRWCVRRSLIAFQPARLVVWARSVRAVAESSPGSRAAARARRSA